MYEDLKINQAIRLKDWSIQIEICCEYIIVTNYRCGVAVVGGAMCNLVSDYKDLQHEDELQYRGGCLPLSLSPPCKITLGKKVWSTLTYLLLPNLENLTFTDSAVKQKTETMSANSFQVSKLLLSYNLTIAMIYFGNFHKNYQYTKCGPKHNISINEVFFHKSNFGKF